MTDAAEVKTESALLELAERARPFLECTRRVNRPAGYCERVVGFVIHQDAIGLGLSEPLLALDALIELARIGASTGAASLPPSTETRGEK